MTLAVLGKAALVLLACSGIAAVLRRRSAATRHVAWAAGLAAAAALPALALVLPALPVPWPAPVEGPQPAAAPIAPASPGRIVWEDAVAPAPTAPVPTARPDVPWSVLYLSVSAAVLAISMASRIRLRRRVAGARAIPHGDPRRRVFNALLRGRAAGEPRLLEDSRCPTPIAIGWRRGRVILPPASRGWPEARLRAVLVHEIAHLDRCDAVWRLIADVACALHWIDPLTWLAAARLRRTDEEACDDAVLRSGRDPSSYAADLLALSVEGRWARSAAGAFAVRGALEGRVAGVLGPRRPRGPVARGARLVTLAGGLALLPPLAAAGPAPERPPAVAPLLAGDAGRLPVQARWSGRGGIGGLAFEGTLDLDDPAAGEGSAFLVLAFRGDDGALRTLQAFRGSRGARVVYTDGDTWIDPALDAAGRKLADLGAAIRWRGEPVGRAGRTRVTPELAGSVMTGLPATTRDTSRGTLLAGWTHRGARAGLFLCGTEGIDERETVRALEASGPRALPVGDCLVAWEWDAAAGTLVLLEVSAGRARHTVGGAERPVDRAWLADLLSGLDLP